MPRYSINALTNFANTLQPTIIPQSAGDREEARIRRLTDLAQLTNLQNQPALEARRLALTKAGLDVQTRGQDLGYTEGLRGQDVQLRGQDLGYEEALRGQDIQARGQDVQIRGQDLQDATDRYQTDTAANSEHNRIVAGLVQSAVHDNNTPLKDIADIMEAFDPKVAAKMRLGHEHEKDAAAQDYIKSLTATKAAGDQKSYDTIYNELASDPETLDRVKRAKPDLFTATAPGETKSPSLAYNLGQVLGAATKAIPPVTTTLLAKSLYDKRKQLIPKAKKLGSEFATGFGGY